VRIVICGAEATGKTSLAMAVATKLGYSVLEDPRSEALARHGYMTLYEAAKHVEGVWEGLIRAQLEREQAVSDTVIDTGLLDLWALFVRWGWNQASPETIEELASRSFEIVSRLNHVVVLPPIQVAGFAGHRFTSSANAGHVDRVIRHLIDEWGLEEHTVYLERPGTEDLELALVGLA